jgi:hypothetical protein
MLIASDLKDQNAAFVSAIEEMGSSFLVLEKKGINIILICGYHYYDLLFFFIRIRSFDHVTLLGSDGNWTQTSWKREASDLASPYAHSQT